jgi:hypothetical protein
MPCTVKKTFGIARDTGNHLLVQLKANQAKLFDAVCIIANSVDPAETAFARNTGRSRQEDRTVEVFPVGDALAATEWQPFVKTFIRVTRHTWLRSAATGLWDQRGEVAYYLSSATGLTPTAWGAPSEAIGASKTARQMPHPRQPWHHGKGTQFRPQHLAKNRVTNVASALWDGALSLDHVLAYKEI